jgi:hypothetical protein
MPLMPTDVLDDRPGEDTEQDRGNQEHEVEDTEALAHQVVGQGCVEPPAHVTTRTGYCRPTGTQLVSLILQIVQTSKLQT